MLFQVSCRLDLDRRQDRLFAQRENLGAWEAKERDVDDRGAEALDEFSDPRWRELDAKRSEFDVGRLFFVGRDFEMDGGDVLEQFDPLLGFWVKALGPQVEGDDAPRILVEVLVFDHRFQLVFTRAGRGRFDGDIEVVDGRVELVA